MPTSVGNLWRYAIAPWMCGILAAAVRLDAFSAMAAGARNAETLAAGIAIDERMAQALLDGLLALGLVTLSAGEYRNTEEAAYYLVPSRADYLGGFVELGAADMAAWSQLSGAVQSGEPIVNAAEPRWDKVVLGIAPLALAGARAAAERLDIEGSGGFHMLDIGGGAGTYCAVWLALNSAARATQIDWANVNAVAREHVMTYGVADRFATRDGDLLELDYGEGEYDLIVLSLVSHFFSPAQNQQIFRKIRRALAAGGTLVLADLIVSDEREGKLWALGFSANMLLSTKHGTSYRRADYLGWLRETGFRSIDFAEVPAMPYQMIYAQP